MPAGSKQRNQKLFDIKEEQTADQKGEYSSILKL